MSFQADLVFIEGILLYENQSTRFEWPDVATDVDTIPGGAVDVSYGARKCRLTITNARNAEGNSYPLQAAWHNGTTVEVKGQQLGASESVKGKFKVREYSMESGTDGVPVENATLQSVGPVPKLE